MVHVCAKPACGEVVQVWLDFAPATQHVRERVNRGEISVGLCAVHEARFSVPEGWSFERLGIVDTEVEPVDQAPAPTPKSRSPRAEGRPWFLAASDSTPPAPVIEDDLDTLEEPTVGSLLHRAFHGPDQDIDEEPETAQLPFPPFEPEQRVAVS